MNKTNTKRRTQRVVPPMLSLVPNAHDKAIYEKALIMAMAQENITAAEAAHNLPTTELLLRFMAYFDHAWEDVEISDFTSTSKMVHAL